MQKFHDSQQAEARLRAKWGRHYSVNMRRVRAFVDQFGSDEVKKYLDEEPTGNSPGMAEKIFELAHKAEDRILRSRNHPGNVLFPSSRGNSEKQILKELPEELERTVRIHREYVLGGNEKPGVTSHYGRNVERASASDGTADVLYNGE